MGEDANGLQHTLQAITLNHALREGRSLWTAAGRRALQDLALPRYTAQRRDELLSLYTQLDSESNNWTSKWRRKPDNDHRHADC
jgi:hypothetical protein